MKFMGLLIIESLRDDIVLDSLHITRREVWNVEEETSFQPSTWNAVWFDGKENHADEVAGLLIRFMHPEWYCNIATERYSYVVFGGKVFKYPRGDKQGRAEAQAHGQMLGLPEEQLDWGEDFPLE
jgi:hypothetical protein